MMRETIEQRGGHLCVPEHGRPLAERQVGGDDDRCPLVEPADEMEEQLAAGLGEGEIAELVHNDEVEPGDEVSQPPLFAIARFRFEPIDEIDDVVEASARAVADAHASDLSDEPLARTIFQLSEGLIGEVVAIVSAAAAVAVRSGEERITKSGIEALRYVPVSKRRRAPVRDDLL